jgi:hypothetical protein
MAAAAPPDSAATASDAVFPFASLPPVLALKIFAALPADTRLRCAEVCKPWCDAVAERSLWTRLDLSHTSGVTHEVTPALLRAAAAKARGALTALDVSDAWKPLDDDGALRAVLAANAGTLRELRCLGGRGQDWMRVPVLEALLSAAPQLRLCEADMRCDDVDVARRVLRNEGVFSPLRVHAACLFFPRTRAAVHAPLFADMATHASLAELHVYGVFFDEPEVLDAFVDAALSLPLLRTVKLLDCTLSPASASALARLLGSGTLTELTVCQYDDVHDALLDAPGAALVSDALRANSTLTSLHLCETQLWSNRAVAATLLGALTGHASLRKLRITAEGLVRRSLDDGDLRHIGALLGVLIAANAPALTALGVNSCGLGDGSLRPLFEALPANSHLRELDCSMNNISDAFAADVLLPAVRANTSLRVLCAFTNARQPDAACEAQALVARRSGQGEAAAF